MARVEHLCVDGKWREGPTSECEKHKKNLSRPRVEGADTK